ncbi:MAG: flavodoxin [Sulfuricurvum sp. RIFOXYD2_FULL_44_160]|uniref:NAD(P)H-dependent oxidoreductase n=1 Tax=unclassified Sulfuricurvum TaxID=2632390 RepID=UPI0008D36629|nr:MULTISPECIES: NAD(P)H-dependent oxidoreductase [unclassified Sulfuricurvum]OHD91520.1 MAG: flavodoxin [Sulfuricurvum sp. RIFOXYD2_FULL_44_160]OHD93907.1 MAG: flavodoxin [Sulfuricurvum sp. RIFOXYD12_FULL_44_77]
MKHVLLLNLHQKYEGFANGNLTHNLLNEAKKFFSANGYEVRETSIEEGYDVAEELEKFKWADIFFVQSPVYWMGLPWLAKKYVDEVFTGGNNTVTYVSDGRSRDDASKKYGSGGLMQDKKYMLSFTYNCPVSEFNNPNGFFEGMSVDQANIALHKLFQFCGAQPLQSYSVHDVYKSNFNLEDSLRELNQTLVKNFA